MISKRYKNDGKANIKLNDFQKSSIKSFLEQYEQGGFDTEEYDCECGCKYNKLIELAGKDRYGIPVSTKICPRCGLIMSNPRMTQKSYDEFYDVWYRHIYVGTSFPEDVFFDDEIVTGRRIWNYLTNSIDLVKISTVLEIGCGAGGILNYFKARGKVVKGIDLGEEYLEYGRSRGLDLEKCHASHLRESGEKYDLIILNHVFEHLLDLHEELMQIRGLLSPKGYVYIAVPGLFNLAVYNDDFLSYLQNAHVRHFCAGTLRRVMRKYGFKAICCDEMVRAIFQIGEENDDEENYVSSELLYLGNLEKKFSKTIDIHTRSNSLLTLRNVISGKKVICYGAGKYGGIVSGYLKSIGIETEAFLVTHKDGVINDDRVIEISEFRNSPEYMILITVSEVYSEEIIAILREKQISNYFFVDEDLMIQIRESVLANNNALKRNISSDDRCFILGMGPSIAKQKLDYLKNETVFSCSFCTLLDKYKNITPMYYVTPALSNDGETMEYCKNKASYLNSAVVSPIIIADYNDYHLFKQNNIFEDKKVFYLGQGGVDWDEEKKEIYDLCDETPGIQTASIMMLKVAMYIGYKQIYLLGTEHDLVEKEVYEHAYSFEDLEENYPDFYEIMKIHNRKVEQLTNLQKLRVSYEMYREYNCINRIAINNNISIYNATLGGSLDVFQRVDYEKLF